MALCLEHDGPRSSRVGRSCPLAARVLCRRAVWNFRLAGLGGLSSVCLVELD